MSYNSRSSHFGKYLTISYVDGVAASIATAGASGAASIVSAGTSAGASVAGAATSNAAGIFETVTSA